MTGVSKWLWWFGGKDRPGPRAGPGARRPPRECGRRRARAAESTWRGSPGAAAARARNGSSAENRPRRLLSTAAAGARTSDSRSATLFTPENAASSMVVWNRSSSATISSIRSSEVRPSSSIVVPGPTARPAAYCASSASTDSPAPALAGAAPVATQAAMSRRFSLRVPSVRGSSAPGHIESPRIFW